MPFAIPESLRDLSKVAKKQDAMPSQDLQFSLDMDMIPSFGTESMADANSFANSTADVNSFATSTTDANPFATSTTDANTFTTSAADSNPFAAEATDVDFFSHPAAKTNPFAEDLEEPAANTNPFAEGFEEAEEAERQALEALKDPNAVPAIISDNRDKLKTQWRANMQKWRSTECVLRDKAEEITAKQEENAKLREQIEALQRALDESQSAVEQKRRRGRAA